ncbi:hypothetical protein C8J48_1017 [Desmospora activa DSM 45169]|uniref:Uncharacterized protein n=1 Tax=Desmospora activa DSM 45169 TaxID=1121389 RepID=A0A2T4Z964_9BACL|nr:hypothetical protein C8J48_1017 [Desmospora activa DSM 45169]
MTFPLYLETLGGDFYREFKYGLSRGILGSSRLPFISISDNSHPNRRAAIPIRNGHHQKSKKADLSIRIKSA